MPNVNIKHRKINYFKFGQFTHQNSLSYLIKITKVSGNI